MSIRKIGIYLLIITLLCCALQAPAFAQPTGQITDITARIDKNAQHDVSVIRPGTILEYPLTADMFAWSGTPGQAGDPVTTAQLRQSNITVRHSAAGSQILKEITLSTMQYNGQTTASVRIEFAEELVSVNALPFRLTIFLSIRGTRNAASEITLFGDFENEEVTIDSGTNFASLAGGKVLSVAGSGHIASLEIDMGDGVRLFTRASGGMKYYATARNRITTADNAILARFPDIVTIVRLRTVNVSQAGSRVSLRDIGDYHVYDAAGNYLGRTGELVAFSEVYYLTGERVDMSGLASGNASDSPGAGSAANNQQSPFGDTPEESTARAAMASAAAEASTAGSGVATTRTRDLESISPSELVAMFEAASRARMRARYIADTSAIFSTGIQGRIEINPALAVGLNRDILLGVHTQGPGAENTAALFRRHYSNRLSVIHLSHEGSYGMRVRIAARIHMPDADMTNLYFYHYDRDRNRFRRVISPNSSVDQNGFLHFDTIFGGDIIVSEGPLTSQN